MGAGGFSSNASNSEQITTRKSYRDNSSEAIRREAKHSSFQLDPSYNHGVNYESSNLNKHNRRKKTTDSHLLKKNLMPFGSVQTTTAGTVPTLDH